MHLVQRIIAAVGDGVYKDVDEACKTIIKPLKCFIQDDEMVKIIMKNIANLKTLSILKRIYN